MRTAVEVATREPSSVELAAAYAYCARVAGTHYENFTIGSWLLPRRLRHDLAAVYAFARGADDIADEGEPLGGPRHPDRPPQARGEKAPARPRAPGPRGEPR